MFPHQIPAFLKGMPKEIAILMLGQPGIGKTTGVYDYAKAENIPLHEDSLVSALPEDVRGLPHIDKEEGMTSWLPPVWWRMFSYHIFDEEPDEKKRGILFFDELPSAPPTVQVCAQKMTQERQIGMYRLHPNIQVILAGNRKEDGALVSSMPAPLRTKLITVTIDPHLGALYPQEEPGWIQNFALPNDVHEHVVQFLRFRPELFCDNDPKRFPVGGAPNPRSWETVSKILKAGMHEDYLMESLQGAVGQGPATEFLTYREIYTQIPTKSDIQNNPKKAAFKKEASFMYAVTGFMTSLIKGDVKMLNPCLEYFLQADAEFKIMFLSDIITIDGKAKQALPKSPCFKEYAPMVQEMFDYTED